MKDAARDNEGRARLLRFLSKGPATVAEATRPGRLLVSAGERGTIEVERGLLAALASEGLLTQREGHLMLAPEREIALPDNHRDIEVVTLKTGNEIATVAVNLSESPLGQLMRRKGRDGAAFLTAREFQAGERLRSDYTRGQIMPRLGANWVASVSSGRRDGAMAELNDAALAARIRVEKAIRAVGPELSGVLIDVCCFLKGMETVEIERGWPVRSAKIVLKTALGVLSRHYYPEGDGRARQMFHWGSQDYRPSIT